MDIITVDTYRVISILTGMLYLLVFIAGLLSIARAVDHPELYVSKSPPRFAGICFCSVVDMEGI